METNIDLKSLELKAWSPYARDGFWDLFFGLMMLSAGISTLTDNSWFTLLLIPNVLMVALGRIFVTVPRVGRVVFSRQRNLKIVKLTMGIGVAVMLAAALLAMTQKGILEISGSVFIVLLYLTVFALMAYFMNCGRLFIYGVLFANTHILWSTYGEHVGGLSHLVSGIIVITFGLITFIRFLRANPRPVIGEPDGD